MSLAKARSLNLPHRDQVRVQAGLVHSPVQSSPKEDHSVVAPRIALALIAQQSRETSGRAKLGLPLT
jgi:hypothetical protein